MPLQSLSSPGRRSPLPPRSWGSRRSSWNSLGRAPSLKRRDTSGERESLLSGEGGEEEDGGEARGDAGSSLLRPDTLELLQASTVCPAIITEYSDCNGRSLTSDPNVASDPKDDSSPEDDLDDDVRKKPFKGDLKDLLARSFSSTACPIIHFFILSVSPLLSFLILFYSG